MKIYPGIKPQNCFEFLIWWFIVGTYLIYALALLYPLNSLLAWSLGFFIFDRQLQERRNIYLPKFQFKISSIMWIWIIAMLVMGIGSLISCFHNDLGLKDTFRVMIRWAMGGALMGLFPLVGCLPIRPQLIYRAVCILCLQSLFFIPIGYGAYIAKLPPTIYSLPLLDKLTTVGEIFYKINLYSLGESLEFQERELRLFLFAPWGPALGLVGSIYFFIALKETNKQWRAIGIVGSLAMCLVSVSRTSIIALLIILFFSYIWNNWQIFIRTKIQLFLGFLGLIAGIFSSNLIRLFEDGMDVIINSRAASSRIRIVLGRIALRRWYDSPIWGYAQQVEGSQVVAHMPIGSHHTWIGLLYTKGIVGFISLIIPIFFSLIYLLTQSKTSELANLGLNILLVLILYSFTEEIYLLSYLYWPALLLLGIAFNEKTEIYNYIPSYDRAELTIK
jgi:hypothetical protein